MDALVAQSIRGLRSRLEAFRLRGPIPSLMAEFRLGAPQEDRRPLVDFEGSLFSESLCQLQDGAEGSRTTWLIGDSDLIVEFRNFCTDAARAVLPTIRAAGFAVGPSATQPRDSWLWAVFELAALRLPGTYLRLVADDVLRACAPEITITESALARIDKGDPLFNVAAAAGQTRYWRLASAVEASVAVLDLAESAMQPPAPVAPVTPQAKVRGDRPRNTRDIDVDHHLGRLETQLRKHFEAEFERSESAVMEAMIRELYGLSSDDLEILLDKRLRRKVSARTIRRKSERYASWERYRRPAARPVADVDLGPAYSSSEAGGEGLADGCKGDGFDDSPDPTIHLESGRRPSATDAANDAMNSGHLSKRAGGRGATHIGKTAAEKAADDAADRFARDAGIDLPPAE